MKNIREERRKMRKRIDKEYEWYTRRYIESYIETGESEETHRRIEATCGFSRGVMFVDNKYDWASRFDAIWFKLEEEYGIGGYNEIKDSCIWWVDKLTGKRTLQDVI